MMSDRSERLIPPPPTCPESEHTSHSWLWAPSRSAQYKRRGGTSGHATQVHRATVPSTNPNSTRSKRGAKVRGTTRSAITDHTATSSSSPTRRPPHPDSSTPPSPPWPLRPPCPTVELSLSLSCINHVVYLSKC